MLVEVCEGHIVRNLLANGLLDHLTAAGAEVMVLTPGARSASFVETYKRPGVRFQYVDLTRTLTRLENYEFYLGRYLGRRGHCRLRRAMWHSWGEPMAARRATQEKQILDSWKPDVVVATHLSQVYGRSLVALSRKRGIPTVGNLNSWDNVWKGLRTRPDAVTCWSKANKKEISTLAAYRSEQVEVIGAPAFDAYFAPDAQWSREAFCHALGLDPSRPILLFATLGQFKQQIDETSPLEELLRALDEGRLSGTPQIVLRLHPWSRETYFARFIAHPAVTVSRYEQYVPGLTWTPTRDETIAAGNLMRYADVVISPGSTMSIEPAIFDTPVVVPVFNEYMPEAFETYFEKTWLNQHFGRLYQNDWLPIVRSGEAMCEAINRALAEPTWYAEGRRSIRETILGPLDGEATKRFAEVIMRNASRENRKKVEPEKAIA